VKYFITIILILTASILFSCNKNHLKKDTEISSKDDTVIMYSTSWCYWCKKAKEFLTDNNIQYIEKDLESTKSYKELIEYATSIKYKGNLNVVPLFIVRGKIILGFQPLEILNTLERKEGTIKTYSRNKRFDELKGSNIFKK
jgi:mycoredoxin